MAGIEPGRTSRSNREMWVDNKGERRVGGSLIDRPSGGVLTNKPGEGGKGGRLDTVLQSVAVNA